MLNNECGLKERLFDLQTNFRWTYVWTSIILGSLFWLSLCLHSISLKKLTVLRFFSTKWFQFFLNVAGATPQQLSGLFHTSRASTFCTEPVKRQNVKRCKNIGNQSVNQVCNILGCSEVTLFAHNSAAGVFRGLSLFGSPEMVQFISCIICVWSNKWWTHPAGTGWREEWSAPEQFHIERNYCQHFRTIPHTKRTTSPWGCRGRYCRESQHLGGSKGWWTSLSEIGMDNLGVAASVFWSELIYSPAGNSSLSLYFRPS